MSIRLEDKSVPELLDISTDVIRKYCIMFEKILGSTPEEARETQDALEGFTPAMIREALKRYRSGTPDKIIETQLSLEGFTPTDIRDAVRICRLIPSAEIQELAKILREFNPRELKDALKNYRRRHR